MSKALHDFLLLVLQLHYWRNAGNYEEAQFTSFSMNFLYLHGGAVVRASASHSADRGLITLSNRTADSKNGIHRSPAFAKLNRNKG